MKAQGPGTTGNVLGQCTLFPVLRCCERPGRTGNGQVPLHQDPTRLLPVRPSCSECCVVPWTASPKHQTHSLVPRLGDAEGLGEKARCMEASSQNWIRVPRNAHVSWILDRKAMPEGRLHSTAVAASILSCWNKHQK